MAVKTKNAARSGGGHVERGQSAPGSSARDDLEAQLVLFSWGHLTVGVPDVLLAITDIRVF